MYSISRGTYAKAKKLGVKVKPSTVKGKKIDVFNLKGEKIVSIGALGMNDFYLWQKKEGLEFANKRRKAYKSRHEKDRHKKGTAGYYAFQLLWN